MFAGIKVLTFLGLRITMCLAAPELQHARSPFDDWEIPDVSQVKVSSSILDGVFKEGLRNSSTSENSIVVMEAAMQATYQALPKNKNGLLSRNAAAYLVQRYVLQVDHYSLRGVGPDNAGAETEASNHPSKAQQTSAPEKLQSLLESRHGGHGLALRDAALLAVMMRKLVMDLDVLVVHQAFHALSSLKANLTYENVFTENELEQSDLGVETVVKVVWAWEWLYWHNFEQESDFFVDCMVAPTHVMDEFGNLARMLMEAKFYRERHSRNPFKAKTLSIADIVQLVHEATQAMGMWQDHDCKAIKRYLIKFDPDKDGRVPLDIVHSQPQINDTHGEQIFRFSESQDYLRNIGGLDESDPSHPQVLISNYVLGPANCYKSLGYQSFCCLNECDAVLTEVERSVGGPSAKPDVILPLLENLTTPSMDEPRPLSTGLVAKLSGIAAVNGGMVPLHGRLFAQWLHFAFPHECPYPHITQKDGAGNSLSTSYFQGAAEATAQWTDDEMLPLIEEDKRVIFGFRGVLSAGFMLLAVGAMCSQLRMLANAPAHHFQKDVMGVDLEKCM